MNVQPLRDGDPRRLGDYDLTGRLGEGGQGVVYLGAFSGGRVAVKLLHASLIEDSPARARFVREVEVTKRVARFCTAQVLSVGTVDGRPYIVSEYVPGPSLHHQVRGEGPRRGSALDRLAINTATALAAIHQAGVVHRDFKPGNVLMGPDGPVVIDFGIARALDASGTMTGAVSQVVGTPAFMAPEQLSEGPIGPPTDMFAWAVTMVYAASGAPAFGHRSIPQVINRILHQEPDLGDLDGRLRPVVAACLTKDPARRPTARQLMDELMGHSVAPPSGGTGATTRLPTSASYAAGPGGSTSGETGTRHMPETGTRVMPPAGAASPASPMSPGGTPAAPGGPGRADRGGPRKGRIALVVAAVAAVLIAAIGAVAATRGGGNDDVAAPPPSPETAARHHRTEHRAPPAVHKPSRRPPAATVVKANPYTPQRLCGAGFRVVGAHAVGEGRTYLLYNGKAGTNCVVTMIPRSTGRVPMSTSLVVKGGRHASRSGAFPFYAGPVRLPARGKCVMWGGSVRTARWISGWSHCGK